MSCFLLGVIPLLSMLPLFGALPLLGALPLFVVLHLNVVSKHLVALGDEQVLLHSVVYLGQCSPYPLRGHSALSCVHFYILIKLYYFCRLPTITLQVWMALLMTEGDDRLVFHLGAALASVPRIYSVFYTRDYVSDKIKICQILK